MLHEIPIFPRPQDVHISCDASLVEPLVTEFQQQLAETPDAEIYDYGWSCRFQQGYIVVAWKGRAPAAFLSWLDHDERLEGHSVYDLPTELPLYIAEMLSVRKQGSMTCSCCGRSSQHDCVSGWSCGCARKRCSTCRKCRQHCRCLAGKGA